MVDSILLSKLEENLNLFQKMYDIVRLVDPIKKKVIEYHGCNIQETNTVCCDYWGNGEICNNCISVRAYLCNKCYIKLEQTSNTIMVVTAVPIQNATQPIIIELLKDATDSMLIGTGKYPSGYPIQNIVTELNDLIVRDELTGIYNRRYIDERLPVDIVKSSLSEMLLSVIFIDLDNLKEINDTFGHVYGDKVINKVTKLISKHIRKETDWVARYGGDEFLICLNNSSAEEAYQIAERIRCKIAELKIRVQDKTIRTTASLGVYTLERTNKLTAEEVIALADNRMYEAKKSGKNKTFGFNK